MSIGEKNEYQLRSHIDQREISASEDTGPRRKWIVRSHVDWREEQVLVEIPH